MSDDPSNMQVHNFIYSLRDQQWMEWNKTIASKIATIFRISPQELGRRRRRGLLPFCHLKTQNRHS